MSHWGYFRSSISRAIERCKKVWWLWFGLLVIEELVRDRGAAWANSKIDKGGSALMTWVVVFVEWVFTTPLGIFAIVACPIILAMLIHGYFRPAPNKIVVKDDEELSDLGKKILKALTLTVTKNVTPPTEDELLEFTKLDRLKLRVEYRDLRRKELLYKDHDDRIHLSEKGEDYAHKILSEDA